VQTSGGKILGSVPDGNPVSLWAIESTHIQGKAQDSSLCEDTFLASPTGLNAVIDGVTSLRKNDWVFDSVSMSSGKFASLTAKKTLEALPAGTSPREVIDLATRELHLAIEAQKPGCPPEYRPACSISVFDPYLNLAYSVGDCWIGFAYRNGSALLNQVKTEEEKLFAHMRGMVLAAQEIDGHPWFPESGIPDPGREAIIPLMKVKRNFGNTTGKHGFGLVDGSPVPSFHLRVLPAGEDVRRVVLATDGYPALKVTSDTPFEDSESQLQEMLAEDPRCVGILAGTKGLLPGQCSYDDRAWVSLVRE